MTDIKRPEENSPSRRDRSSLGWFGLGILVGAVAAIGLMSLTSTPRSGAEAQSSTDIVSIREAARLGAKDALLENSTGVTLPLSLADIRDAAKQGAKDALQAGSGNNPANPNADSVAAAPINMDKIAVRQHNVRGDEKATVTLIEYSDFQCPFCKRFHDTVLPRIVTDYVNTGKIKLAFKNFAFLGDESRWAAQGAECAADQNRFWDIHELLFSRQTGENMGTYTKANLVNYAQELKLDVPAFTSCLNQDKTLERVQTDTTEGNSLGVRGTPSFLINGKLLVGAQPYEAFKSAIDEALKAK
jgi:protein-disulfide isomerase